MADVNDYDVIVLGGGAAGLMCAAAASARGRRVLVLEGANRLGKKILMSGGGRCNFTNLDADPSHFISANPKFCISALSRYTQWDFIELVRSHGIAYHEKTQGQLFCDDSSKAILAMLVAECTAGGVTALTNHNITAVAKSESFEVSANGTRVRAPKLVVATGGLSIPKMGASDVGYRLARQFGIGVRETRAGLVPFMFSGQFQELNQRLAGVALPVVMSCGEHSFAESMLFTHRGISGPAALQVSSYWAPGQAVEINLLPEIDANQWLQEAKALRAKALLRSLLNEVLPRALVDELQALYWPEMVDRRMAETTDEWLRKIAGMLNRWVVKPAATEGYRTAEVTLGGVDTAELSSKTMESQRVPGLFFIGEVVDVSGHLGGFNFQWAWSSAQAAGRVV